MRWSNDSHLAPTTTILLLSRPPPGPPPSYWHLQQCLVLLVTCLLLSHLPSVSASVSAREGQGGKEDAPKTVCGTRFTDIASSALLADVVLEGRVQQMVTPQGEGGPLAPGVRYNVSIQVRRRVWKGRELVNRGKKARKLLVGTFLSSAPIQDSAVVLSDDNGIVRDIVGGSRAGVVEGVDPQIEEGGDELGDCVADVAEGSTYIFFLRNVGHKKGRYFVISAVPVKKNRRASRTVKKILKPNAAKKPSIQRLKGPRAVKAGSSLTLRCKAKAKPNPVFTWFKDGEEVTSRRGLRIKNNKRGSRLKISKADKAAAGVYTCQAANALGEASKNITIKVRGSKQSRQSYNFYEYMNKGSSGKDLISVTTPELIHVACQKQTYCFNGGTCRYIPALHQSFCQCPKQWAGHRCEILDLYGPGNKDKTREAKLEFERVLIIVGIVIALLVFVVICIASYFLANRRRKRWAARRRMKQRLGPESDLLLDKTDGARLTHFAPSSKPLAQKETQTDFNFQPPTYPPNPDLEAKPPNLIHHHAYPKSSANNIFLHDGSFPPPLTRSVAATVAAAAPPPQLPSTISNPKPARPVSNIESRDLERNGLRGRLKAVSVTENGIGDRPWNGMSQVPDSKSMPIILDSEGDMLEVIELNKLSSCPPSSSSPGLNSTRDEVDSLLHMPPALPDKSQISEQGGAEDFSFNLLEDGKAPDDSPHFPSYFDSLDPPGEVSKSGTEEGEKKPLPVNGVVDSWESDDEAPDKPLLPLHISEEDLNGNVPRMDSFDLESPSPPLPPHPEPLARDGHSPSLSSLSGSGPVSRPADLPPVPGRDPDQRPGSVSEDDSAGFLPHTLSSTEASSPLTEGTPQGETYAFDPSLDSDPDDLDEQFMHGSPRKGTGCYRGAEDKQDYERRLRNVCADQDAIPI